VENLKFALEPVAIYFTGIKPDGAAQFKEGARGCVADMLIASAKGKTVAFDEKTCGCPGGGVGLCFGDRFTKDNSPIECRLSTGDEALAATGKSSPVKMGAGERFFASPELAGKWRDSLPYAETKEKYVVFKPLSMADANDPPDLVCAFANADQLSALITLSGFDRGDGLNAIAPFGAACHQILFAYQEIAEKHPKGIIGFFDIAQRHRVPKELLSYTVPYGMFLEMEKNADASFLTTEAWGKIAGRL